MTYQIADLRQYFIDRIFEIDPTLSQWELDPFGIDSVGDRLAEKYYKILIGETSFSKSGTESQETIAVMIEIYSPMNRDELGSFDALYQKAFDIKDNIVCPENYSASSAFSYIIEETLLLEPLGEDDKSMKFSLQFNVMRIKAYR